MDISEAVEQSSESAGRDLHVEVSGSPSTSHFWAWRLSCVTRAATSLRRLWLAWARVSQMRHFRWLPAPGGGPGGHFPLETCGALREEPKSPVIQCKQRALPRDLQARCPLLALLWSCIQLLTKTPHHPTSLADSHVTPCYTLWAGDLGTLLPFSVAQPLLSSPDLPSPLCFASCCFTLEPRPLEQVPDLPSLDWFWEVREGGLQVWVRSLPRYSGTDLREPRRGQPSSRKQEPSKPGWRIAKVLPWTTTDSLNALTSALSPGPWSGVLGPGLGVFFPHPMNGFDLFRKTLPHIMQWTDEACNIPTRKRYFLSVQSWSFHLLVHTWAFEMRLFSDLPHTPYWGIFYTFRVSNSGTVTKWRVCTSLSVIVLFLRASVISVLEWIWFYVLSLLLLWI